MKSVAYYAQEDLALWQAYIKGVVTTDYLASKPTPRKQYTNQRRLSKPSITAKLDLHGMTQEQAHHRLSSFIANAQKQNKKCVLIVTGKGREAGKNWWESSGILREQVPHWLDTEPNKSRISTYSIARPEHGGIGALYVFIRKGRS